MKKIHRLTLIIFVFTGMFNGCAGYYFSERYKILYGSKDLSKGSDRQISSEELAILENFIINVGNKYNLRKVSNYYVNEYANSKPEGVILFAYASDKDSTKISLVYLTETFKSELFTIDPKKFHYQLYIETYSEKHGKDVFNQFKDEIVFSYKEQFGNNSILNIIELHKRLKPPEYTPYGENVVSKY